MKKLVCAALVAVLLVFCVAALAEGGSVERFEFSTTDVDGNAVTSAEVFAGNRITMVNFWATWCPPCVGELADLARVHTQLQEMGCGVVGILVDDDFAAAHSLMAENGTNYPMLSLSEDMANLLEEISVVPTTFFVDETGAIVGERIEGAFPDQYVDAVKALMSR